MSSSTVSMKLLIDTQSKRVLFAEASKDCVDFLFHLLSLPIATVVKLLKQGGMVGSLTNIYESVENLNESYLESKQSKNNLLNPTTPSLGSSLPMLMPSKSSFSLTDKQFYGCSSCSYNCSNLYFSDGTEATCPNCNRQFRTEARYVAPPSVQEGSETVGYVKGVVTYMVMDDLVIKPMSTISSLTLLSKFNIKDVALLEEKLVKLDMTKGIALLKASMESSHVLTNVFLKDEIDESEGIESEAKNIKEEKDGEEDENGEHTEE